jgi:hypothetical protein
MRTLFIVIMFFIWSAIDHYWLVLCELRDEGWLEHRCAAALRKVWWIISRREVVSCNFGATTSGYCLVEGGEKAASEALVPLQAVPYPEKLFVFCAAGKRLQGSLDTFAGEYNLVDPETERKDGNSLAVWQQKSGDIFLFYLRNGENGPFHLAFARESPHVGPGTHGFKSGSAFISDDRDNQGVLVYQKESKGDSDQIEFQPPKSIQTWKMHNPRSGHWEEINMVVTREDTFIFGSADKGSVSYRLRDLEEEK